MSDSKSPHVSRTLLSIMADLNKAVLWMVSTSPLISKSSSLITNPLVTVPRTSVTVGITVIFMPYSFFSYMARPKYLPFFSLFFRVYSMVSQDHKVNNSASLFVVVFLLTISRSGRLAEIRWPVCLSKSLCSLYVSFSRSYSGLCKYHFSHCQISVSCTISSGSPSLPSRV